MLITSDRCWFRAIYSLFRALSTSTVCRLSSYIHVPTVAKSSRLPILVSANEAPGSRLHNALQRSFISFCSAVKILCCAVCSSDSWDGGDYIFIRRGAYGGSRLFEGGRITFSSAPAREREERGRLLCLK